MAAAAWAGGMVWHAAPMLRLTGERATNSVMRDLQERNGAIGKKPGGPLSAALDKPYSLLMSLSLALALSGGFGLGLYLLLSIAFKLSLPASTPALIQVHGQVQALGFVMMFIMAVGVQIIPRFHSSS